MLTYCTRAQFEAVKVMGNTSSSAEGVIDTYLRRATRTIDSFTHRQFFPWIEGREFTVPSEYINLRLRAFPGADLPVDQDLLEALNVDTGDFVTNGIVNGTFDADTDWTKGTGWTISGGVATKTAGTGSNLSQASVLTDGAYTRLDFTVRNRSAGTLTAKLGATGESLAIVANGDFSVQGLAGGSDVILTADANFDGDLDDVVLHANLTKLVQRTDYVLIPVNLYPHWALRLVWPNFWTGTYSANIGGSYRVPSIRVRAFWGCHEDYRNAWLDSGQTVPSGGLTATATSIAISAASLVNAYGEEAIPANSLIRIGDELIEVLSYAESGGPPVNTTTYTVVRGVRGSVATAHVEGDRIQVWRVSEDIIEACYMIAKAWREHDAVVAGRYGSSGSLSAPVEIDVPPDAKAIMQRYVRPPEGDMVY